MKLQTLGFNMPKNDERTTASSKTLFSSFATRHVWLADTSTNPSWLISPAPRYIQKKWWCWVCPVESTLTATATLVPATNMHVKV